MSLLLKGRRRRDLHPLEIGGPRWCLRGSIEASRGLLEGLELEVEWLGCWFYTRLECLELGIEQASIRITRAEALSGRVSRGEAVLLEGAVELALLLELLQRVRRPAECVGHLLLNCPGCVQSSLCQSRRVEEAREKRRRGTCQLVGI